MDETQNQKTTAIRKRAEPRKLPTTQLEAVKAQIEMMEAQAQLAFEHIETLRDLRKAEAAERLASIRAKQFELESLEGAIDVLKAQVAQAESPIAQVHLVGGGGGGGITPPHKKPA